MSRLFSMLRRTVVGAWWALDVARRTLLNLLLLLVLLALTWWALRPGPPPLVPGTTLVLDLQGPLREQFTGSARDNLLRQARGDNLRQVRLRDVLVALDAAGRDPAIARVLLMTDDFAGAGPASLREVATALQRVRAAGKPVWAWAAGYSQAAYFLAAQADQVFLHPMGEVSITGYGGHRLYFGEALSRVGVQAHVLRAGAYKNAGETWVARGPSPQTLEADRTVLDALWLDYTTTVEQARKLPAGSLAALIDQLPARLAAVGGDGAALARQAGLVDALKTPDELEALLREGAGDDPVRKSFRRVGFGEYLARQRFPRPEAVVGVVVAEGEIRDGDAPPGAVGGDSTAALIRRAREDERVKALVLRVDSPGGSAFASERIRRELVLTRAAGKPVVVSMGDVAASGGYWIATASDEVIADPSTITGSIGVIAMFPGFHDALARLGLHTGGHTTTWLAGAADPSRPLDPRLAQVIQSGVDHTYAQFTRHVADARQRPVAEVQAVAQGRIWTGAQAMARGLVDRTGRLDDALAAAAQRAKLADGSWRPGYIEAEPGRLDRLVLMLGSSLVQALPLPRATLPPEAADLLALARAWWPAGTEAAGALGDALRTAGALPPGEPLAHCLCGVP